jgi:hypothetical protein
MGIDSRHRSKAKLAWDVNGCQCECGSTPVHEANRSDRIVLGTIYTPISLGSAKQQQEVQHILMQSGHSPIKGFGAAWKARKLIPALVLTAICGSLPHHALSWITLGRKHLLLRDSCTYVTFHRMMEWRAVTKQERHTYISKKKKITRIAKSLSNLNLQKACTTMDNIASCIRWVGMVLSL